MNSEITANARKAAITGGYQWLAGNQAYVPPVVPCEDVAVTDTDLTVHNVASGGVYVCTIPPPVAVTSTKTFTFAVGGSLAYEVIRIAFDATIDLSAAVLVNVATVAYKINGTTVTGSQTVVNGDTLTITITKTSSLSAATVALEFDYDTDTEAIAVPDYRYVNWTNLVAMSVDSDTWESTNRGLVAAVNGTDAFDKGASSVESFSGQFTLELDALNLGSVFGASLNNTDGPNLNRAKYSWYCFGNNRLDIYANGGAIDTLFVSRQNAMIYNLRIVDTGARIEFYYRPPGVGSWTLRTFTTSSYSAGTTYYASLVSSIDGQRTRGVKIYA